MTLLGNDAGCLHPVVLMCAKGHSSNYYDIEAKRIVYGKDNFARCWIRESYYKSCCCNDREFKLLRFSGYTTWF